MCLLLVVAATAANVVAGCGRGGETGLPGFGGSTSAGGGAGAGGHGGAGGGEGAPTLALLVDHDQSSNNSDPSFPPSYSDALFEVDLNVDRVPYETTVVPSGGGAPTPAFAQLARYTALVWYTADGTSDLFSSAEQAEVERWLDLGHKTLVIFSENLLSDIGPGGAWTAPTDDTFLTTYLGAAGWAADGDADVAGTGAVSLKNRLYTVNGAAGTPLAGMHFEVFYDTPLESTADLVNPGAGTVVLATVDADPADKGTNAATPIVVAHTVGTSTVIYAGMPIENIDGAPENTNAELVHGILQFAGLAP